MQTSSAHLRQQQSGAAEQKLQAAYLAAHLEATPLLEASEYEKAMAVILKMKEPVDSFFTEVMVMVEDEQVRANRLNLLTAIARLFLQIGDFSKMTGNYSA